MTSGQFEHESHADRIKRIDRMIRHIRHAEYLFYQTKPRGVPSPISLIWILLQDAMTISRKVPFDELRQVSRMKSVMPDNRITPDEAYYTELSRLLSGMSQYDRRNVRTAVNADDVDRMVDVLDLMRFVTGRDHQRLRKTVLAYAAGMTTYQCGIIWNRHQVDFDRRTLHYLKQRVCGQILKGLDDYYMLSKTGRGFRRREFRQMEAMAGDGAS